MPVTGPATASATTARADEAVAQLRSALPRLDPRLRLVLLATALAGRGAALDTDLLARAVCCEPETVAEHVEAAKTAGWLRDDGTVPPQTAEEILRATPEEQRAAVRSRLLDAQLERGEPVLALARRLLGTGATGSRAAAVLTGAGDEVLRGGGADDPGLAAELYTAAVAAGASASHLAARRAEAAALRGDADAALRFADQAIADPQAPDRDHAALVAAAVLAHRGLLARSAELYRWLDGPRPGRAAPLAVLALLGVGEQEQARRLLTAAGDRPPTLLAGAEALMARGLAESVTGSPTAALSALTRAATLLEPAGRRAILPDTPAALAALVALHAGQFELAGSVLDRALAARMGGPLATPRHQLLRAWTALLCGEHAEAGALLQRATASVSRLEPRDELVAAALQVGVCRRVHDVGGLAQACRRAAEAVVRHPVDLPALLPLGELAVGAARLRDAEWVTPHLAEAHALLNRLGDPPLWAAPLHWNCLHAALAAQRSQQAARHAEALTAAGEHGAYPATLAAAAACWLQVTAGSVDAAQVQQVTQSLHAAGLGWEGSRLAGQAAIRTTDRKEMSALLALARTLHGGTARATDPASAAEDSARRGGQQATRPGAPAPAAGPGELTDRERDIAALLLDGLTYKQIGARLFISAKTVEHHVARIRQRLGCEDRAALLTRLRTTIGR